MVNSRDINIILTFAYLTWPLRFRRDCSRLIRTSGRPPALDLPALVRQTASGISLPVIR
jgi:hypothetical protein